MDVVNRCAMVIKPKEPYFEWANRVSTSYESLEDFQHTAKILLVPPSVFEARESFLRTHAQELFEMELVAWLPDQRWWPIIRDAEVFQQWFEISFHELVIDFADDEITKEPFC